VGDAVTWTNAAQVDRQIRAVRDGVVMFDTDVLQAGDSFTFVFMDKGQFPYTCSIDGSLTGTITVEP
jgi:plastocyanin